MSQLEAARLDPQPEEVHHMQFAALLGEAGNKLHVGCIMDIGYNWVDLSLPLGFPLPKQLLLTFYPDQTPHDVEEVARKNCCVRLEFRGAAPTLRNPRMVRLRRQPYAIRR